MARTFGIVADPVLAGTGYDALPVGKAIPAPVQSWPVDSVTVAGGAQNLDRLNEWRGGMGTPPAKPYKRSPVITVSGTLYPELLAILLLMGLGSTSRTGTAPAAITDKIVPAADSALQLPGAHLSWEEDGLFEQAAGAKLNSLTATFPEDGYATYSATFVARWHKPLTAAPAWAAPSFSWLGTNEWPMMLRDAAAFEAGSSTAIDCLKSFSIEIPDIYRAADFCARKEREDVGSGNTFARLWWPGGFRRSARRQLNGSMTLRGLDQARENKMRVLTAEQLVVEVDARPLATTPVATELARFTLFNAVQQPAGDRTANRDDDLDTSINWTGHLNSSQQDVQFEYVNNRSSGIVVPTT